MDLLRIGSDQYKTIWDDGEWLNIHIEKQSVPALSYRDALLAAIQARNYTWPAVFASGGLDSELATIACVEFYGQKFNLFHIEFLYEDQLFNSHERYWIERMSKKLGMQINFLKLDLKKFFVDGQYLDYAKQYLCASPQIAVHLWALDQVDRPAILGGQIRQGPHDMGNSPPHFSCYRYWQQNSRTRSGCELLQDSYALYYLSQQFPPSITRSRDRTIVGKQKSFLYTHYVGFPWEFVDRPKHTGFELIQQQYAVMGKDWNQMYRLDTLHQMIPQRHVRYV